MPRGQRDRIGGILTAITDIRTDTAGMNLAAAGIRDRIVHEYFRTNTRRIWDVVQDDLDPLEKALQSAIGRTTSH